MKISQKNFIIAWENKKLIRGALKYAHVRMDYDHYDDLYQNAVITYAEMLEKYADLPREQVDKLSFRRIYWNTLNELHKVELLVERGAEIEEAGELIDQQLNWDELLILKQELAQMSELERKILIEHIGYQHKMVDINRDHDVARMTLHRMKKRLLLKLRNELK